MEIIFIGDIMKKLIKLILLLMKCFKNGKEKFKEVFINYTFVREDLISQNYFEEEKKEFL